MYGKQWLWYSMRSKKAAQMCFYLVSIPFIESNIVSNMCAVRCFSVCQIPINQNNCRRRAERLQIKHTHARERAKKERAPVNLFTSCLLIKQTMNDSVASCDDDYYICSDVKIIKRMRHKCLQSQFFCRCVCISCEFHKNNTDFISRYFALCVFLCALMILSDVINLTLAN